MQYLLYCVVCFKVWSTTKEVFVIDVMDATLTNRGVFRRWHVGDVEVASAWYVRANGIPPPPIVTRINLSHNLSHFWLGVVLVFKI